MVRDYTETVTVFLHFSPFYHYRKGSILILLQLLPGNSRFQKYYMEEDQIWKKVSVVKILLHNVELDLRSDIHLIFVKSSPAMVQVSLFSHSLIIAFSFHMKHLVTQMNYQKN